MEMESSPECLGSQGCGPLISVNVSPTTGGDFRVVVDQEISVDNFKKIISKRLKVPRDRICLLFRDKQLQEGNLGQHGVTDGSRVTLLPNVETGLVTQRPEAGIMQALESLNDTQVNEFLCGKAPLNLSMRLGEHMMLIQLQLTTVSGPRTASSGSSNTATSNSSSSSVSNTPPSSVSSTPASTPSSTPSNTPFSLSSPTSPIDTSSGRTGSPVLVDNTSSSAVSEGSSTGMTSGGNSHNTPPSLLQASRNLQSTLRRLSADVFSGRDRGRRENIYSGTFSGALNPALQDPRGRPRRDVATIVHILNDLLCSVPELRRVHRGTRCEEPSEPPCSSQPPRNPTAPPSSCSEAQNSRTRGKLEHLRLVMGERRERRRQRKQKPYSVPPSDTDTVTA